MKASQIRQKYIQFFVDRGHKEIPSASLVPENDPTTLFTNSGMQQLVPYLKGEVHPMGDKLVDSQPCIRAEDIDEVGDNRHTTFFEMLGNWSFGDYFKKEQLQWFFEFLTESIELDPDRLYVSVFEGDDVAPRDKESIEIWQKLFDTKEQVKRGEEGFDSKTKIYTYDATKNWWSRAGVPSNMPSGEVGGTTSEVFFDFGAKLNLHEKSQFKSEPCHINCDCGRFFEIGNSVFMEYEKQKDGSFKSLPKKNVDFGGGLERIAAAKNDDPDIFKIDLFTSVMVLIKKLYFSGITDSTEQSYQNRYPSNPKIHNSLDEKSKHRRYTQTDVRIIADHLRASVFLIKHGVIPSNKERGYVLRRLLRRAAVKTELLKEGLLRSDKVEAPDFSEVIEEIIRKYEGDYFDVEKDKDHIIEVIQSEVKKFGKTLHAGLRIHNKVEKIDGKVAFDLYQTYGFPFEITKELSEIRGQKVSRAEFDKEFDKHQKLSRTASAGMFKGGLADHSEQTTRLHTAHHLLLAALQKVVDPNIKQRGSNITGERLRIDVSFVRKFNDEELAKVEKLINGKIDKKLPVRRVEMKREDAESLGAQMEFGAKYPDIVSIYLIGLKDGVDPLSAKVTDFFSAEFCGGPHVENTGDIGTVKIIKEQSAGAGIRRLYAKI